MPPHWTNLQPITSTAIVSKAYTFRQGEFPQAGPVVDTTGRPRALIGWIHQNDTADGLMKGQLYTSVNGDRLMIFDTSGNRSSNPGQVVFCGTANFTMIRYVCWEIFVVWSLYLRCSPLISLCGGASRTIEFLLPFILPYLANFIS